ncbi:pyruvate:ferredoxin oxidoreductase and related 2-oxoacid:ferredoxin oxidoreductases, alpha subunit [Acidovorax sp. MR-S7]|nr:pyruvate:ferredoxin oxidoreductase and related 2-oxoacid:ferredoxin oxidoreductases, alpha subunit [Acidovorax sp. MR-S7]
MKKAFSRYVTAAQAARRTAQQIPTFPDTPAAPKAARKPAWGLAAAYCGTPNKNDTRSPGARRGFGGALRGCVVVRLGRAYRPASRGRRSSA